MKALAVAPRTMIVIVNYKVGDLVVDCLRALSNEVLVDGHPIAEVVIVDNPSGDNSVAVMRGAIEREGWGSWARVIESPANGGFAFGNNTALRDAHARGREHEYVWFLNPDTVPRPGALQALTRFLDVNPSVGLAGSSVEQDEEGTRWPYAFRFPGVVSEFASGIQLNVVNRLFKGSILPMVMGDEPAKVGWLSGCSFAVRSKVFKDIGLMDEQFFLYYEETDFCRRAAEAGWSCWYVPTSRVYHIAGRSTGVSGEGSATRRLPDYWFESRRRYFLKHHGRAYTMAADVAHVLGYVACRARRTVMRTRDEVVPHYVGDFVRHSAWAKGSLPGNARLPEMPSSVSMSAST